MDDQGYHRMPCPIATMDAFSPEFLAACHAEAHNRAIQADLGRVCRANTVGGTTSGMCGRGVLE